MDWRRWLGNGAIFLVGAAFTSQFFIVWCDLIYNCGCTFEMLGGADHCNIQQPGPPDCPWCVDHTYGAIAFGTVLTAQAFAALGPGRPSWHRLVRTLLASPLAAGAAGIVIGLVSGYWRS